MEPFYPKSVGRTYGAVADDYAAAFADDLDDLPLDRAVLDDAASRITAGRPVVDIGCGPAQVADYLAARGLRTIGVDLAPGMLEAARRRTEGIPLVAADMRVLPFGSGCCGGAIAFYSLQHVPRAHIAAVLTEIRRVLAANGVLVVATHLGTGELTVGNEWFGKTVEPIGATLHDEDELTGLLRACGFEIEGVRRRPHLPHEADTERLYLTALSTA
jgi:ubiquinone/menaquinone biosynthesis C-methylase UbiE